MGKTRKQHPQCSSVSSIVPLHFTPYYGKPPWGPGELNREIVPHVYLDITIDFSHSKQIHLLYQELRPWKPWYYLFPKGDLFKLNLMERSCEVKKKVQQKASATEPNTVTEPSRSATMQKKSAFEDLKSTLYENNYKKSNFTALINEPF